MIADSYAKWTRQTPCHEIKQFTGRYANRGAIELVFICRALHGQGFEGNLIIKSYPNYGRALLEVIKGRAHIAAETIWESEINSEDFYQSETVIEAGEFFKGVYVLSTNEQILGLTSMFHLKEYIGLMNSTWKYDHEFLEKNDLPYIPVPHKTNIFELLKRKRGD